MQLCKRARQAFTLVELLVVIGIIALLIAILMPALSRARKQALQVSCGSNARQVTYAALAYANDWDEALPTRIGRLAHIGGPLPGFLNFAVRLPIIGHDTGTIWDWGTYCWYYGCGSDVALGGWGFMMRDYLKNDFDIYACPDGFYKKSDFLRKWDGTVSGMGPIPWPVGSSWYEGAGLIMYKTGYLWLPHRDVGGAYPTCASQCGGPITTDDNPGEVSKTASDLPSLLVIGDFSLFGHRYFNVCSGLGSSVCGVIANHNASSHKQLEGYMTTCMPQIFPPGIGREENPMEMPLGQNVSRIDARTTWGPFQDWRYYRFSSYDHGSDYGFGWHGFGKKGGS